MPSGQIGVRSGAVGRCFVKAMRIVTGSPLVTSLSLSSLVILIPSSLIAAQAPRSDSTAPFSSNTRSGLTSAATDASMLGSLSASETTPLTNFRAIDSDDSSPKTSAKAPTTDQMPMQRSESQVAMIGIAFTVSVWVVACSSLMLVGLPGKGSGVFSIDSFLGIESWPSQEVRHVGRQEVRFLVAPSFAEIKQWNLFGRCQFAPSNCCRISATSTARPDCSRLRMPAIRIAINSAVCSKEKGRRPVRTNSTNASNCSRNAV